MPKKNKQKVPIAITYMDNRAGKWRTEKFEESVELESVPDDTVTRDRAFGHAARRQVLDRFLNNQHRVKKIEIDHAGA